MAPIGRGLREGAEAGPATRCNVAYRADYPHRPKNGGLIGQNTVKTGRGWPVKAAVKRLALAGQLGQNLVKPSP